MNDYDMTQQEIQERNKQIALMLDIELHESQLSMTHSHYTCYHSDWNWLMEAVQFIKKTVKTSYDTKNAQVNELFIDEWEFKVKRFYIRLIQWTKNGWRMFDENNRNLSILYIIGENCRDEKEAVFLVISDFAKLYNNKEL